jgi:hypothetical protein
MSYQMQSESGEEFKCSNFEYQIIICTAKQYDWDPMGTYLPLEEQLTFGRPEYCDFGTCDVWPGLYLSAVGQMVSKKDARHMSYALERAVDGMVGETAILFRDFIKFLRLGSYATW